MDCKRKHLNRSWSATANKENQQKQLVQEHKSRRTGPGLVLSLAQNSCGAWPVWYPFLSGGPKLKCAELLSHVMEVLRRSFSCAAYGEDYSTVLLKDILSVRKYWCEISSQQWHGLSLFLMSVGFRNSKYSDSVQWKYTISILNFVKCYG